MGVDHPYYDQVGATENILQPVLLAVGRLSKVHATSWGGSGRDTPGDGIVSDWVSITV